MTVRTGIATSLSKMITVKVRRIMGAGKRCSTVLSFFQTFYPQGTFSKRWVQEQYFYTPSLLLSAYAKLPSPSITAGGQPVPDRGTAQRLHATATLPPRSNLVASTPGSIRVQNSTYHPIRIALLPQVQANTGIASIVQQVTTVQPADIEVHEGNASPEGHEPSQELPQYGDPIHWDFVPREGHDNGLILAVSEEYVKVQPGDVLTAFAQDGSRQYWGPYVVGVTEVPVWNSDTQEWSLVLETPFPW